MSDKTPPFQIPTLEMPRASGEVYPKLKNGQRVQVRLTETDEWASGVILIQGYEEGRLLHGYKVRLDSGSTHVIEYRFLDVLIRPSL